MGCQRPSPTGAIQGQAALPAQSVDAAAVRALDDYVGAAVRDWNLPGLAIAVVAGDSVVFAKGYGLREVGRLDVVDTAASASTCWSTRAAPSCGTR